MMHHHWHLPFQCLFMVKWCRRGQGATVADGLSGKGVRIDLNLSCWLHVFLSLLEFEMVLSSEGC